MDIKLNIYKDRFCRTLDKEVAVADFDLSLAICEEVLNIIHIDAFSGGLQSLSKESQEDLVLDLLKNALPYVKDLLKELYELTDEEIGKTKIEDIAKVIIEIVKYSMTKLGKTFGRKN